MKEENQHIDKIFQEGLSNSTVTPPAFVWDTIETKLNDQGRQKKTIFLWRSISAASVIGLIFLAGLYWHTPSKNISDNLNKEVNAEHKEDNELATNRVLSVVQKQSEIEKAVDNPVTKIKSKQSIILKVDKTEPIASITTSSEILKLKEDKQVYFTSNKSSLQKLQNNGAFLSTIPAIDATNTFNNYNKTESYYAVSSPVFINPFDETSANNDEKKRLKLALGGQVSPNYSYREVSSSESYEVEAAQEEGIVSFTGGLNLNIKTPKRWSFETGIYYAQVGQKFSNPIYAVANSEVYMADFVGSSSSNNKTGINLDNSLGKIKLKNSEESIEIPNDQLSRAYKIGNKESNNSYSKVENFTVQQELDFIEVPFLLRYDVIDKSVILSLSGGVSTNFLIGNNAYQVNNSSKTKIGETENINDINYSAVFGIGFRTPIWKSIEFNLEPKLRYFMNSVTNGDNNNYRPYSVGIYTGISYRFNRK